MFLDALNKMNLSSPIVIYTKFGVFLTFKFLWNEPSPMPTAPSPLTHNGPFYTK